MMEVVIKECRPQMVGNYYEPYHLDYEDIYAELDANRNPITHSIKVSHYMDDIEYLDSPYKHIQYSEVWETIRWGSEL